MRVLVVARTHDHDDGEAWIDVEGELAILPPPADADGDAPSDTPGGFVGLDTLDPTSIVAVAEMEVSPQVLVDYVRESLVPHRAWDAAALLDTSARLTAEMLDIARRFPVGSVLTVEGSTLTAHIPVQGARRPPVCDPGRRDRHGQ